MRPQPRSRLQQLGGPNSQKKKTPRKTTNNRYTFGLHFPFTSPPSPNREHVIRQQALISNSSWKCQMHARPLSSIHHVYCVQTACDLQCVYCTPPAIVTAWSALRYITCPNAEPMLRATDCSNLKQPVQGKQAPYTTDTWPRRTQTQPSTLVFARTSPTADARPSNSPELW